MSLNDALQVLNGERLSAVTFLRDYLQLDFDGHVLSVYARMQVDYDGAAHVSGKPGFRDALCQELGEGVTAVSADADKVEIRLVQGAVMTVSLKAEDRRGDDAVSFESYASDAVHVA